MERTKQQDAVITWLASRAGVSRENSGALPAEMIEAIVSNPRDGLLALFTHLERKAPPDAKLRIHVRELTQAIGATQQETAQRVTNVVSASPETEKELKLDRLIAESEAGLFAFEQRLRANAAEMQFPPYLRPEELYSPFDALRINQTNPHRNMVRRRRQIASGEASSLIALPHPNQFFYDLLETREAGMGTGAYAAAFVPMQRVMMLPPQFDSSLVTAMLVEYHEIRHANQDTSTRLRNRSPQAMAAYEAFHTGQRGERPRVMVGEEASAYGYELEALNVLLKGRLRTGTPSAAVVMQELGCRPEERGIIETLLAIAPYYFPEGGTGGVYSVRYLNYIKDLHLDNGYDVYIQMTTGIPRQLNRHQSV